VLIIADDLDGVTLDADRIGRNTVVVIGTSVPREIQNAAVVLPITNFSEEEGTFTNIRGRVQRFMQAKAAPGLARPSWLVLGDLLGVMGAQVQFFLPSEVFANLASSKPQFAGLSYETLGTRGLPVLQTAGAA
jgi:NADH-quinone oxidoreductase subunit G